MAAETPEGDLAVKVLDEYMQDFQRRNPTLRVFCCYLHQDEATPHLHIDFVPYVTGWKGKGMDTRVSLKQALKSLGFQGGAKHDTELNQWINHEKEVLAEIMERYEIEWEQKGTHEEHLEVYNFKKKERAKEVKELEQKIENLAADVEAAESDIKALNQEKADAEKARDQVRESKEQAEKEFKHIERMHKIDNGQNYAYLDEEINSVHSGSYGRLVWNEPAATITTRFDTPAGGRFIHPDEDRTLSPREAARIQSFPDGFVFYGTRREISRQIGNAVPPKISYFLARYVQKILEQEE